MFVTGAGAGTGAAAAAGCRNNKTTATVYAE